MSQQDDSPFLYHYTTVESLALIVKNQTIKFTSLDALDDKTEGLSKDAVPLRRFVYVSCWTNECSESIPMWNMYSSLTSGVRIKLKKKPFKIYDLKDYAGRIPGADSLPDNSPNRFTLIPSELLITGDCIPNPLFASQNYLYKIEYTSDESLLCPQIISTEGEFTKAAIGALGKYKDEGWSFQKEYRYIFEAFPSNLREILYVGDKLFSYMIDPNYTNPILMFTLKIDDKAFAEMEVTMSPKISMGNRVIIEMLKENFNPSMKIHDSSLAGKLR